MKNTFCAAAISLAVALSSLGSSPAYAYSTFSSEIAAITERAPLAPNEALARLERLDKSEAPLTVEEKALLFEQFNRAKFYVKDFEGALHYGKLLETLGQKSKDRSIECSGLLAQVYANWRLGNIESAYELARRAEKTPAGAITQSVRIQALLAVAQLEADELRPQAALLKIDDALKLAENDESLQYTIKLIQTKILLAANDIPGALSATDYVLALAHRSTSKERTIRAKAVEFTVALAADQLGRADRAMAERIRIMKQLELKEGLGAALVEYAEFKLNSSAFQAASTLSKEAIGFVKSDKHLMARGRFTHAIAEIQMGRVQEGKLEIEELFQSNQVRDQLLRYLPQYISALSKVGETNASLQTEILRQKLEAELALSRAKESEKSRGTLQTLSRDNKLKERAAVTANGQRNAWLAIAIVALLGLTALIWRYVRLRAGARDLAEANRQSELALAESTVRQTALRQQALEAQIRILQAQIEPHFLFNTLANLRYLYRTNLQDGEEMLDHLIGYLRSAMDELRSETSTIGREIELTRHYLSIMSIRMGDKLTYNISCTKEVADTPFPPALLLTLVENAIKHGIPNKLEGRIDIVVTCDDETIWLTVLDNGAGVSTVPGTGVGLANIRQRLEAAYGDKAKLQAGPLPNGGFAASIMLPLPTIEESLCQPQ